MSATCAAPSAADPHHSASGHFFHTLIASWLIVHRQPRTPVVTGSCIPSLRAMSTDLHAHVTRRLARIVEPWTPLPPGPAEPPAARAGGRSLLTALDPRALRALLALIAVVVLIAAWMWWQGRPRDVVLAPQAVAEGTPITSASASPALLATGDVVVHVAGDVHSPGVFTLASGSRVGDAIAAAGGVTKAKSANSVNLARPLVDGEQILVGASAVASGGGAPGVSLNAADAAAFEALPGVGPVLAKRIVDWRSANGPFRSIDELGEVSGIGDALLGQLRPLVRM